MDNEVLVGVEISQRTHQIQVKTMMRGKGRHSTYASLQQAPEAVRGEALVLIREALHRAGYGSMTELESSLAAGPVVPDSEAAAEAAEPTGPLEPVEVKPVKARAKKTLGDEAIPLDDAEFEIGGG
jgi:hypothetical protein